MGMGVVILGVGIGGTPPPEIFGSRVLSIKRPLLSVDVHVCLYVRNFEVKYLGIERS